MPTIKYTREDITKLENERDQLKHQDNLLREDITLLKKNQKTRDKLIDNLKEENANLNNELDQYKTAHNKLTAGLKEAVAESIKYKRERDSLIKDVEKLRVTKKRLAFENKYLEKENEELKPYKELWGKLKHEIDKSTTAIMEMSSRARKYGILTNHIRDKANNNPGNSRYIALVHFIDDLEADTHD